MESPNQNLKNPLIAFIIIAVNDIFPVIEDALGLDEGDAVGEVVG